MLFLDAHMVVVEVSNYKSFGVFELRDARLLDMLVQCRVSEPPFVLAVTQLFDRWASMTGKFFVVAAWNQSAVPVVLQRAFLLVLLRNIVW